LHPSTSCRQLYWQIAAGVKGRDDYCRVYWVVGSKPARSGGAFFNYRNLFERTFVLSISSECFALQWLIHQVDVTMDLADGALCITNPS
jgi:hypothetical protein